MDKESTEVHVSGVEAEAMISPAEAIADKAFEAWVEALELELKKHQVTRILLRKIFMSGWTPIPAT